ncbi:MAG: riboflavin biosynthesis protein RibF [Synergistales bacterium]|nr:riboflavin biosynthesis protein RibF [Synergistales bacterium]
MIAALGSFDGYHLGHQLLLSRACAMATRKGKEWGVLTFDPHPQEVLSPSPFERLFLPKEQRALHRMFSVPRVAYIPFSRGLADCTPEHFLEYIEHNHEVEGLVVGHNFCFGRGRSGTVDFLRSACQQRQWSLDIISPVVVGGTQISSTRIRKLVTSGNVTAAKQFLGYPFFLYSSVVEGDQRGAGLGFPTANLFVPEGKALPPSGVYACAAGVDGSFLPAAVNVGFNPTFLGLRSLRLEAHLLDFDGNLYGKHLYIFFLEHLRPEQRFTSVNELKEQMARDCRQARHSFLHWRTFQNPLTEKLVRQ